MAPRDDEELRQDNGDLTGASRQFELEMKHFTGDIRSLFHVLEGIGDFAGNDDTGHKFKEGYGKAVGNVVSYVHAIEDAYQGIVDRLQLMTVSVDLANWASMAALPKVPDNGPVFSADDGTVTPGDGTVRS